MTGLRLSDYPIEAEPAALIGRLVRDLETGDEARVARVVYSPASNELLAVVLDFGDLDEDDCAVWVGAHPDELELVMDA